MTVGSNGPHGAAPSGNGTVPFNGLSMAPRRGKDGNTTMTLFVRNTGSTTPGAASGTHSALLTDKDPGPDFGLVPDAGDAADDSNGTDVVEAVGNALSAAVDTVTDSIPAIRRAAHRPTSIVAGVFFYFVLVIVYMLFEARHILGVELALQSLRNDRLISMSSSVTEQLLAKNTALNKARQTGNVSEVELIALEEEVSALDERRLTLLKKMAQQMAYSGPVDDIQFLIEEHVAYEELVKSVAAQETEWARDGEALKRSIESRRLDVDEKGRPINELALDFDRFLYGLAINKWEAERLAQNTTASESTVDISPIMSSAESFISFDKEVKAKSQWMRDAISRIRNNRVLALAFVSILAVVYFRFA